MRPEIKDFPLAREPLGKALRDKKWATQELGCQHAPPLKAGTDQWIETQTRQLVPRGCFVDGQSL